MAARTKGYATPKYDSICCVTNWPAYEPSPLSSPSNTRIASALLPSRLRRDVTKPRPTAPDGERFDSRHLHHLTPGYSSGTLATSAPAVTWEPVPPHSQSGRSAADPTEPGPQHPLGVGRIGREEGPATRLLLGGDPGQGARMSNERGRSGRSKSSGNRGASLRRRIKRVSEVPTSRAGQGFRPDRAGGPRRGGPRLPRVTDHRPPALPAHGDGGPRGVLTGAQGGAGAGPGEAAAPGRVVVR